jgi:hypothetical protein
MFVSCLRTVAALLWLLGACSWAQQGGKGVSLLVVALVSPQERQQLEEDIAKFEAQAWDLVSLDQQMNEWASQRDLLLHKSPTQASIWQSRSDLFGTHFTASVSLLLRCCAPRWNNLRQSPFTSSQSHCAKP